MTTNISGQAESFQRSDHAKPNVGRRRNGDQEDNERRVMFIDTECDLKLRNLREIAWCVFDGEHTSLECYSATISMPDNASQTAATALPVGRDSRPSQNLTDLFSGSESGRTISRDSIQPNEALRDLVVAVKNHRPSQVVGHNIEFDVDVIRAFADRTLTPVADFLSVPRLCTILATYRSYGEGQFLTLGSLHEKLFGRPHSHAHNALTDTKACARCYWKLCRDGHLSSYNHQEAIKASKAKSWLEVEMQSRRLFRSLVHSAVAKRTLEEKALSSSEYCGGVDRIVVSRIHRFSSEQLRIFRRHFADLFSINSATHVLKALSAPPGEHVIKPETAWRCVKTYCVIASMNEREELFNVYCSQRKKPHVYVKLDLGEANEGATEHINKWTGLNEHLDSRLSDLSGGDGELKARCLAEHINKSSKPVSELADLMKRCTRGERSCLGQRDLELPWALLTVTVVQRSLLKRVLDFLR